ncbi:MAG: class I SAM-dependent methyltransferase [Terriglobales bacterium]
MSSTSDSERKRWNEKYRGVSSTGTKRIPDPFLVQAFSEYIRPLFPHAGRALDLAGGAGRHAIWLAKQGWDVTLIDISEVGVELARQNAGPLGSHMRFVVDDLTRFQASQTEFGVRLEAAFDVVMVFFYLERTILPEIIKTLRPGGVLVYKTYTRAQAELPGGSKNPAHLLEPGELRQLTAGLRVLHYRETVEERATAELVAQKEIPGSSRDACDVATGTGSQLD